MKSSLFQVILLAFSVLTFMGCINLYNTKPDFTTDFTQKAVFNYSIDEDDNVEIAFSSQESTMFKGSALVSDDSFFKMAVVQYKDLAELYQFKLDTDIKKMIAGIRLIEIDKPKAALSFLNGKKFIASGKQSKHSPCLDIVYKEGDLSEEMRYLCQRILEYYRPAYLHSEMALSMDFGHDDTTSMINTLYKLEHSLYRSYKGERQSVEQLSTLGKYPRYQLLLISNQLLNHKDLDKFLNSLKDNIFPTYTNKYSKLLEVVSKFNFEKNLFSKQNRREALEFLNKNNYCCPLCQEILLNNNTEKKHAIISLIMANCEVCLLENTFDEQDHLVLLNTAISYYHLGNSKEAESIINHILQRNTLHIASIERNEYEALLLLLAIATKENEMGKIKKIANYIKSKYFYKGSETQHTFKDFFMDAYCKYIEQSTSKADEHYDKIF